MTQIQTDNKRALGVFSRRQAAEQAFNDLKSSGFPMEKVSVIAKDPEKGEQLSDAQVTDHLGNQDVNTTTGAVADTLAASTWGSLLVGLGSLALPGIGAVIAAGSVGTALVTTLAGVAVGAAATDNLVKALVDLGIPEERARVYSDRLIQGDYLVIVNGTNDEIHSTEEVMKKHGIEYWDIY